MTELKLKLIVAEDDPAMQQWLHSVLAGMGASVRLASSGWELLSLLAEREPVDVVISDIRMPMPGGVDALAMARTAGITTPFVLITAFADERLRGAVRGLQASILDKPFLAHELETRIREVLARSRGAPDTEIHRDEADQETTGRPRGHEQEHAK